MQVAGREGRWPRAVCNSPHFLSGAVARKDTLPGGCLSPHLPSHQWAWTHFTRLLWVFQSSTFLRSCRHSFPQRTGSFAGVLKTCKIVEHFHTQVLSVTVPFFLMNKKQTIIPHAQGIKLSTDSATDSVLTTGIKAGKHGCKTPRLIKWH